MAPPVEADYGKGATPLERVVGGLAASVFSVVYIFAPVWILAAVIALCVAPFHWATAVLAGAVAVSAALPPRPSLAILKTGFMQAIPKYFQYKEVMEISEEEVEALMNERGVIFTAVPHGVISFCGICSGIVRAESGALLKIPTAVASVLLKFPFMKNTLGVFGLCDASKAPLTKRLKGGGSVVLYLGGIAELFLSSTKVESLYLKQRAGFIKLALQTGADVVPLYLFGNTSVLSVAATTPMASLSRRLQTSLTLFYGLWGLPVPRPRPLLYARGRPLGLPKLPPEEITDDLVKEWHGKFMAEVERLYTTYQGRVPDYAGKPLDIQ